MTEKDACLQPLFADSVIGEKLKFFNLDNMLDNIDILHEMII